jgi:hypothetical protein
LRCCHPEEPEFGFSADSGESRFFAALRMTFVQSFAGRRCRKSKQEADCKAAQRARPFASHGKWRRAWSRRAPDGPIDPWF